MKAENRSNVIVGKKKIASAAAQVLFLLFAFCLLPSAFAQSKLPKPSEVVAPKITVTPARVAAGGTVNVTLVGAIMDGFHVNSNKPLEDYLIATELEPKLPANVKLVSTTYPKEKLQKFPFSEKPLAVYEGEFTVQMKLQVARGTAPGAVKIPLALRYQACNDEACLPPAKIPLTAEFTVGAAVPAAKSPAKSTAKPPTKN